MRDVNINSIRALDRAIDILEAFSLNAPSLSIDEIVRATKLPKATIYRLLYTMERRGLIQYDESTLRYRLGLRLLKYGGLVTASLDLHNEAEEILVDLFRETQQTVLMTVLEGTEMVYVFRQETPEGLKVSSYVGQHRRPTFGVMGHIMMAYMPEDELSNLLSEPIPQLTPNTITDPDALRDQLALVREQGYLIDIEQTTVGVNGVAAPVFGYRGEFVCAVGVIGPTVHLCDVVLEQAKQKVISAATRISSRMGYRASR
ncbi:IclR family transcriptional regulator [Alicyclobacillus fastidiosus]|uniref:IclR family transcriptional regulator n=1 Tax=Alicyclobacillus fastidiosus TaxID=392011 RepID=A0ABV5AGA4_9BACL|nr:IclR family transcriptional regulator [Alicyclobacillus fastidiosus]WEH08948.1 IclR family transcriptional regulator [Alicyclobacillus fastidiosus]